MFTDNIDTASNADATTPYISEVTLDSIVKPLEKEANLLFTWFDYNQMKRNENKCFLILSLQDNGNVTIGPAQIENSKCQKLMGINIGSKSMFRDHINCIYKNTSTKLNALSRISYYMDPLKRWLAVFSSLITVLLPGCFRVKN